MRNIFFYVCIAVLLAAVLPVAAEAADKPGSLEVQFSYLEPGTIDPTYLSAMWLEDESGKIVRTLYVSTELSSNGYRLGTACPDWVKQAGWSKAPSSLVQAVTSPTPNVGSGSMTFDLAELGVAPGKYRFRYQVNIDEKYNLMFQGSLTVGNAEQELKIETLYQPSKPDIGTDVVKDVRANYYPASK